MLTLGVLGAILALHSPVQAGKAPPLPGGASDLTFTESPPHSDADELKARFSAKEDPGPYDVSKEKFRIVVPPSYRPGVPWGLFIFINADDHAGVPAGYEPVLEKHKLLAVSAYRSGNARNIFDRFRLAIDARFNLERAETLLRAMKARR